MEADLQQLDPQSPDNGLLLGCEEDDCISVEMSEWLNLQLKRQLLLHSGA